MKRIPLWLTVVPLILGVAGYWWFWSGYKDGFREQIAAVFPGSPVTIGGFPYRLEAEVGSPRLESRGDVPATASADNAILNRGPWQPDLTIVRSAEPRVSGRIPALANSTLSIAAPSSETSLHLDQARRIARLSTVFDKPRVTLALLGLPLTATKLEVHFRETTGRSAEAWSPSLPQRAQVVLEGEGVKAAAGAPLKLAADIRVTGPTRLIDYARWASKGTVEIHALTLADTTDEVLRLDATMVASGGVPRLTGTLVTSCPQTVRAALTGERVSEQRLRLPVTLSLSGSPGAWQLGNLPEAGRATRAQQPACPALR
ncbi:DUF2125 domain-containing protein [Sphingosinicellaceae bacterium]|nr:DUF2125 domain-containing protein [Sphingosinicellaceae bacterium]